MNEIVKLLLDISPVGVLALMVGGILWLMRSLGPALIAAINNFSLNQIRLTSMIEESRNQQSAQHTAIIEHMDRQNRVLEQHTGMIDKLHDRIAESKSSP